MAAVSFIAAKIGCSPATLHEWVKKTEVDSGKRAGLLSGVAEKMKALERENCEPRHGGARPPLQTMISFIDDYRGVFGTCSEASRSAGYCHCPSTCCENVAKRLDVDLLSVRARGDISLKIEIRRVLEQDFRVYGVRKVWRQLKREGFDVARCTVARRMRSMSLQGLIRGKPIHDVSGQDGSGPA